MTRTTSHALLLVAGLALLTAGCSGGTYAGPAPKRDVAEKIRGGEGGGGAQTTVAKSTGTGWATLKGVFTLNGAAPNLPGLSTGGKDGNVCGQQVINQALVVDPSTKGIANIVIFARKVSRIHPDLAKPSQTPEIFDQKACIFLSHVMAIRVGQPMDVKNSDPIGHNTNINPPPNKPENFLLTPNQVVPYTYTAALTVPSPIVCNIHPWMKSYLIARDDPYFAVTKPDGSFEIKNLPAGEDIEFQVWHESAGGIGGSGGPLEADKSWSKGRFKKKLAEGSEEKLEIPVPVSAF